MHKSDPKPAASPLKERVVSFLGIFKKTDKRDSLTETVAKPTDITSAEVEPQPQTEPGTGLVIEDMDVASQVLPESAGVLVHTPEDTRPTQTEPDAVVENGVVAKQDVVDDAPVNPERKSLVRRLSNFFKPRRSNSVSAREPRAKAAADEPPKLPETATIAEAEAEPGVPPPACEKQGDVHVSATGAATSA